MTENSENRVLSRMGARQLSDAQLEQVGGGFFRPRCTLDPVTCVMDGICSPPPACLVAPAPK